MPTVRPKPFKLRACTVSEESEQIHLARWLDFRQIAYCHVPNGGERSARAGARLKRAGAKAGIPDLLIFDPPRDPAFSHARGVAIELKTTYGTVSEKQKAWLARLNNAGWLTRVCRGSLDAIAWLQSLGF